MLRPPELKTTVKYMLIHVQIVVVIVHVFVHTMYFVKKKIEIK